MKLSEMTNLFIGYNESENFRILICAFCAEEAADIAEQYRVDSKLGGKFKIFEPMDDIDTVQFDCDYIVK